MKKKKDLRKDWKKAGVNIGHAFANVGKAIAVTAKVVVGSENNDNGEGKKSKTGEAWTNVGHGFADAGKSLGQAGVATVDKVVGDDEEVKKPKDTEVKEENIVDAEVNEIKQIEEKPE